VSKSPRWYGEIFQLVSKSSCLPCAACALRVRGGVGVGEGWGVWGLSIGQSCGNGSKCLIWPCNQSYGPKCFHGPVTLELMGRGVLLVHMIPFSSCQWLCESTRTRQMHGCNFVESCSRELLPAHGVPRKFFFHHRNAIYVVHLLHCTCTPLSKQRWFNAALFPKRHDVVYLGNHSLHYLGPVTLLLGSNTDHIPTKISAVRYFD
jgi:hypothetical protein